MVLCLESAVHPEAHPPGWSSLCQARERSVPLGHTRGTQFPVLLPWLELLIELVTGLLWACLLNPNK